MITFERPKTDHRLIPYLFELRNGGHLRGYLYQYGPHTFASHHDLTARYPSRYAAIRAAYRSLTI